jgi:hypothetical protein
MIYKISHTFQPEIFVPWAGNWKRDIFKDRVLFIVYKIMKDGNNEV